MELLASQMWASNKLLLLLLCEHDESRVPPSRPPSSTLAGSLFSSFGPWISRLASRARKLPASSPGRLDGSRCSSPRPTGGVGGENSLATLKNFPFPSLSPFPFTFAGPVQSGRVGAARARDWRRKRKSGIKKISLAPRPLVAVELEPDASQAKGLAAGRCGPGEASGR